MSHLTQHAMIRMQQRGIGRLTIDYLLDHGRETYSNGGAKIIYFDKHTRLKLMANVSKSDRVVLEKQSDAYLIIGEDGNVVTVGHRTKRLAKH